jgi:hypothetical protein
VLAWLEDDEPVVTQQFTPNPVISYSPRLTDTLRYTIIGFCSELKIPCTPMKEEAAERSDQPHGHMIALSDKDGNVRLAPGMESNAPAIQAAVAELTKALIAAREDNQEESK